MEVVGGLLAAEQVLSTTVEAGAVAAWSIRMPTLPLQATLKQIATSPDNVSTDSLARYAHTITSLHDDLYIFGGQVSHSELAGNEMHILKLTSSQGGPEYQAVPALAAQDGDQVPCRRAGHTMLAIDDKLVLFGGYADVETKAPIDEDGKVWLFDPSSLKWSHMEAVSDKIPSRHSHAAVAFGRSIIIHGGYTSTSSSEPTADTWQFSMGSHAWAELPSASSSSTSSSLGPQAPPTFAIAANILYLISPSPSDALPTQIHTLDLLHPGGATEWSTLALPTNPAPTSPRPRKAAAFVPITTGLGRTYLLLILGEKDEASNSAHSTPTPTADDSVPADVDLATVPEAWSDIWALQLPSASGTPAAAKDVARKGLGLPSHEAEWAEVTIATPNVDVAEAPMEGKQHPGPRSWLAAAPMSAKRVVLWGGLDPKGQPQGDGWFLDIKLPDEDPDDKGIVARNWDKVKGVFAKAKEQVGSESS